MKHIKIVLSLLLVLCLSVFNFTSVKADDTYSLNEDETVTIVFNVSGISATSGTATFTVSDGLEIEKEWFGLKGTSSASFEGNTGSFTYASAKDINGAYVYITVKGKTAGNQTVSVDVNFKYGNTTIYTATSTRTINVSCGSHEFGDWTVTKDATCISEGIKERSCNKCGYAEQESIGLGSHIVDGDLTAVEKSSGTTNSIFSGTCKYCGNTVEVNAYIAYSDDNFTLYCQDSALNNAANISINQVDLSDSNNEKVSQYKELLNTLSNKYNVYTFNGNSNIDGTEILKIKLPNGYSNNIEFVAIDDTNNSINNIDYSIEDGYINVNINDLSTFAIVDLNGETVNESNNSLIIIIILLILVIGGGLYLFFNNKNKNKTIKVSTKKSSLEDFNNKIKDNYNRAKKAHELKKEEDEARKKLEISKKASTVTVPTSTLYSRKVFDALNVDSLQYKNVLKITNKYEFRLWLLDNAEKEKECYVMVQNGEPKDDNNFYYLDALEVALCFGWKQSIPTIINGVPMQKFVKRDKDSYWSELDKQRVRRLEKLGLMKDLGREVLPDDMSINNFYPDEDIIDEFKKNKIYTKFKKLPALYQRVRLSELMYYKRRNKNTYKKLLDETLEATRNDQTCGEYNDYGRLEEK